MASRPAPKLHRIGTSKTLSEHLIAAQCLEEILHWDVNAHTIAPTEPTILH